MGPNTQKPFRFGGNMIIFNQYCTGNNDSCHFFINLHFLLSFPVVWHHCELEPGLNFLQFSIPSALPCNSHVSRSSFLLCNTLDMRYTCRWDQPGLNQERGFEECLSGTICKCNGSHPGHGWDVGLVKQRMVSLSRRYLWWGMRPNALNIFSLKEIVAAFLGCGWQVFHPHPVNKSVLTYPAFPVWDLILLDCQLTVMIWSFQIMSSAVPLPKPQAGQRDFCVCRSLWVCMWGRERWNM